MGKASRRKRETKRTTTADHVLPEIKIDQPPTNSRQSIAVVPQFKDGDPRANLAIAAGKPGLYTGTFVLSIPGKNTFHRNVDIQKLMISGESLLKASASDFTITITGIDTSNRAKATFFTNSAQQIAKAETSIEASSFNDAAEKAHSIILPILSWWSFKFDVAIEISGYQLRHEETGTAWWTFGMLGQEKYLEVDVAGPQTISLPIWRTVFAAYREALNATNPFYQFLCFFKVAECVKHIRNDKNAELVRSGGDPIRYNECMPISLAQIPIKDAATREVFSPYLGKGYTSITNGFKSLVRHAIAHLDPTKVVLTADKYADVTQCERAMPVIKLISREMVLNEIKSDPQAREANLL